MVILDVEMPVMGAAVAVVQLLLLSPIPSIVVVTMHDGPHLVREFLGRGASAYLVKSTSLDELLTAVHTAAESPAETHDENAVMVVPREAFQRAEKATEEGRLSARELEIPLLVARSLSNRQISSILNVAEATVKRNLTNLYPKMNLGSRREATRKALSEGWFTSCDATRVDERERAGKSGNLKGPASIR